METLTEELYEELKRYYFNDFKENTFKYEINNSKSRIIKYDKELLLKLLINDFKETENSICAKNLGMYYHTAKKIMT